uniref:Uncharacterized protein n=1 Tax=Plectus sambesii TaxID=2011161 RepID=A0A914XBG0_9BILA
MALHYAETRHAVQIAERRVDITTTERNAGYIADSESLQSAPLGVAYTDSMSGSRQNLALQTTINAMENRTITHTDQPPPYIDKDRSIEVGRYALFDLQGSADGYKPPVYIPLAKELAPQPFYVNAGAADNGIRRCPIIAAIVIIAILLIIGTVVVVLLVNSDSNRRSPCMSTNY